MANKKAPGKSSKVATKKVAAKPVKTKAKAAPKSTSSALRESERLEVETVSQYAPITEAQAAAYASQLSVADAEKRGHGTKAKDTLREVRGWISIIHRVLGSGANVRYTPARFVFFLMSIDALARGLDASAKGGAGKVLSLAEARARAARNGLLEALEELVLGNEEASAELAEKRGSADHADDVLASVRGLLALAEAWLAKSDDRSIALVESACLTAVDVDTAQEAADALGASLLGKTVTGAERKTDSAEVNRLEGRVTFEMAVAMRAFNAAAARGVGEKLVPGPATRHLFVRPSKQPTSTPT
jgi:hypothetical protein